MLKIENLEVVVSGKKIISDFSFEFKKGKIYALMGPNGSGKSTLALTIAGHPTYQIKKGKIYFENQLINHLLPEKRSRLGLFLSFQFPLSFSGVNVFQLLRTSLGDKIDPLALNSKIEKIAKEIHLKKELIEKSLNESASGGERKKLELLQMAILNPKLAIFDEIDTGVDIEALKIIANYLRKIKKEKTYLIITHYHRILKYLTPDEVLIMVDGRLTKTGSLALIDEIEKEGYSKFKIKN